MGQPNGYIPKAGDKVRILDIGPSSFFIDHKDQLVGQVFTVAVNTNPNGTLRTLNPPDKDFISVEFVESHHCIKHKNNRLAISSCRVEKVNEIYAAVPVAQDTKPGLNDEIEPQLMSKRLRDW